MELAYIWENSVIYKSLSNTLFRLFKTFQSSKQTQSSRAHMGSAGSVIMNMMWSTSPSAQFLLTVSMSLRFSTSCLLSLISLDATHVLIWSRRRWGTRRRRGRDTERRRQNDRERKRERYISEYMKRLVFNSHGWWTWCPHAANRLGLDFGLHGERNEALTASGWPWWYLIFTQTHLYECVGRLSLSTSSNFSERTPDNSKPTVAVSLSLADRIEIRSHLHLVLTGNLYLDTEKHINPSLNSQRGQHNHMANRSAWLEVVSLTLGTSATCNLELKPEVINWIFSVIEFF